MERLLPCQEAKASWPRHLASQHPVSLYSCYTCVLSPHSVLDTGVHPKDKVVKEQEKSLPLWNLYSIRASQATHK
jgi:hypothetical protein